jgi:hypothetical protein
VHIVAMYKLSPTCWKSGVRKGERRGGAAKVGEHVWTCAVVIPLLREAGLGFRPMCKEYSVFDNTTDEGLSREWWCSW